MNPAQPVNAEKLIYEARARITWGDPQDEVREWLVEQGLDTMRIDEILHACMADRAAAVRKRALKEIMVAIPLLLLAGWMLWSASAPGAGTRQWSARGFGGGIFCGCYGLFRLCRGLGWLTSGAHVSGDVSKLGDRWLF